MTTVTRFIANIKQPKGGYLPPKLLNKSIIDDAHSLYQPENIPPQVLGVFIDSFARFLLTHDHKIAFRSAIEGAALVAESKEADQLIKQITGFNNESIISALKLIEYDVAYKRGPSFYIKNTHPTPDKHTLENMNIMLDRCLTFFNHYGPITESDVVLTGGLTDSVQRGDIDFLTLDTLWDMKLISTEPRSNHTFQVLVYYLLMFRSAHKSFENIKNIGLFNPRMNAVYQFKIADIDPFKLDDILNLMQLDFKTLQEPDVDRLKEIVEEIYSYDSLGNDHESALCFLKENIKDFNQIYYKADKRYSKEIDDAIKDSVQNHLSKYNNTMHRYQSLGIHKDISNQLVENNILSLEIKCRNKIIEIFKKHLPESQCEVMVDYFIEKSIH